MDIPTIRLTKQEFDALPVSDSTAWEQTRCKAKSTTGQWLFIDKDSVPRSAVIELALDVPEPADDKVVPFAAATDGADEPAAPEPAEEQPVEMPWESAAQAHALAAYGIAHGVATIAPGDTEAKARIAEIARRLAPELQTGLQAVMAWAGLTLYLKQIHAALRDLVAGAETHPPSKGRHNERVLVYADRLTALVDSMRQAPKGHAEAATWWKERQRLLEDMGELPRIIALCERDMGGAPPQAEGHSDVEKIEGILMGLLGVVKQQKQQLDKRREQVTKLSNEIARNVRR